MERITEITAVLSARLQALIQGLLVVDFKPYTRAIGGLVFVGVLVVGTVTHHPADVTNRAITFQQSVDQPVITASRYITFTPAKSNAVLAYERSRVRGGQLSAAAVATREHPNFHQVLVPLYKQAEVKFGVDPKLLAAVHAVESGFAGDTPMSYGSGAGAKGPFQFMPATFARYGVDGNGDGQVQINKLEDSLFSAAHYLAANGAARGEIDHALYRYNHSLAYVNKVKRIANDISLEQ